MTSLHREVNKARYRLWFNRWLRQWGWTLSIAAGLWMLILIADRVLGLHWPVARIAEIGAGASVVAATIWLIVRRDRVIDAATALDQAAGLRERVSTSLYLESVPDDDFGKAVIADAQHAVAGLSAAKLIRVQWAKSLSFSTILLLAACLSLLLPEFDLLGRRKDKAKANERTGELARVASVVQKPIDAIQKIAEKNPDLSVTDELKALQDTIKPEKNVDPDVLRRETVKKLDRLEDALKNKQDQDKFKALDETKNRLKQIGEPEDPKSEVGKLAANLAAGDFEQARESLKKVQEQLAKRTKDGKVDPKEAEKMKKQLSELAQKIESVAEDKESQRELQNAGLSAAEAKRVLQTLAKKDPKQLEKMAKELEQRLKDKGATEKQMQKMLKEIKQRQSACKQCKGMGEKMGSAAQKMQKGDTQGAKDDMGQADQMLSDMEQMEQTLNEVDSQMSQLDEARKDLNDDKDKDNDSDGKCKECHGKGFRKDGSPCPKCQGNGQCNGPGRGKAPRKRGDDANVAYDIKKEKVKQGRGGRIIGQQFVKGEQLKGKTSDELHEAAAAAELDITDALNKEHVPRTYRKVVRNYFDRMGDDLKATDGAKTPPDKKPADAAAKP